MSNPQIAQLRRQYQSCVKKTYLCAALTLFFTVVTLLKLAHADPWGFLDAVGVYFFGFCAVGYFVRQFTFRREIRNLQMVDEQHVHGKPSPFVDTPPPGPEPSPDNFWGKR